MSLFLPCLALLLVLTSGNLSFQAPKSSLHSVGCHLKHLLLRLNETESASKMDKAQGQEIKPLSCWRAQPLAPIPGSNPASPDSSAHLSPSLPAWEGEGYPVPLPPCVCVVGCPVPPLSSTCLGMPMPRPLWVCLRGLDAQCCYPPPTQSIPKTWKGNSQSLLPQVCVGRWAPRVPISLMFKCARAASSVWSPVTHVGVLEGHGGLTWLTPRRGSPV